MASLTFGSVGDIIAICGILKDVIKSLSDSRGASAEYQSLIKELQGLSQTVYSVRSLLKARSHLRNSQALHEILDNCKDCLLQEYHHVEPYRKALQSNRTTAAIHTVLRKIKWLSTKDDRIAFRAAIASHLLAITGVLISSGIDATHELHQQTINRLEEGFNSLRIAGSQHLQVAAGHQTDIIDAVQQSQTSLVIQHGTTRQQAQIHHAEILQQFQDLQSAFSEIRQLKDSPIVDSAPTCTRQTLVDRNKLFLTFIISLLSEFTKLGWIGVYQFWQIVRLIFLQNTLSLTPSWKCLIVHDAIMEYIYVDINFVSYDDFVGLIEKKFKGTAGEHVISKGDYVFEDRKRRQLALKGAWSSDILAGRTLSMRAQVVTSSNTAGRCPHCGVQVKQKNDTDEHVCKCGLHYVAKFSTRKLPDLPVSSETYDMKSRISNEDKHAFSLSVLKLSEYPMSSSEILEYFKRVQTIFVDSSGATATTPEGEYQNMTDLPEGRSTFNKNSTGSIPTAEKDIIPILDTNSFHFGFGQPVSAENHDTTGKHSEDIDDGLILKAEEDSSVERANMVVQEETHRHAVDPPKRMWIRALYDFNESREKDMLIFKEGDIFLVVTQLESGWWDAIGKNGRGWVPSNFFAILNAPLSMDDMATVSEVARNYEIN